jgi:hypothetical protein
METEENSSPISSFQKQDKKGRAFFPEGVFLPNTYEIFHRKVVVIQLVEMMLQYS